MKPLYETTFKRSLKLTNKKQIFIYEEEEEDEQQQTVTLKKCKLNVESNSSSSKLFKSTKSNSYHKHRHTKKKVKRCDFSINHRLRHWSYATNNSSSSFKDKFILASYNILGVDNASKHSYLYPKVPYNYMKWGHRRDAICKELAQYDPSILCLQEVDCFSDLCDALKQHGFEGVLKARTGDARDGCAIFWKYDRFKLLHKENIEFQSFGLRNNVAQFCVLEMNDDRMDPDLNMSEPKSLIIGNTHILFNPKRGDIKLGQTRLFLERAHKLCEEWGGIPVVLAGDFNSVPQSAVYQYISSAKLNVLQHDRRRICGQIEVPPLFNTSILSEPFRKKPFTFKWNGEKLKLATGSEMGSCLQHNLKLRSAYLDVPGNITTRDDIGEPLATSCHSKFMGTVDYIWYDDQLVPIRVLDTLSRNELGRMGGLPSKDWGSDHLALVCEFGFANSKV